MVDVMITYDLRCDRHHHFEGWFRSRDDYLSQHEKQLVACPRCGSTLIEKCPSVPKVKAPALSETERLNDFQGKLEKVYQEWIAKTEDVGDHFVEEVRKIHYDQVPHRHIRGTASTNDISELREEGIEVISLPWPVPSDSDIH